MLVDQIEGEQRMPQMIKDSKEQNDVKMLPELVYVVHGEFSEFNVQPQHVGCVMCLRQISLVEINAEHTIGSAAFHLDAVESGVATDIEYGFASQIRGNRVLESFPLHAWKIAEEMFRRGLHATEVDVVEPFAERPDLLRNVRASVHVNLRY